MTFQEYERAERAINDRIAIIMERIRYTVDPASKQSLRAMVHDLNAQRYQLDTENPAWANKVRVGR